MAKKTIPKPGIVAKGNLTQGKLGGKIQGVQEIVANRAKLLGMSAYKLAKLTGITEQTIRNFLDGTHEMRSDKLGPLLNVLGLEITVKK